MSCHGDRERPLAGIGILVTRPRRQSSGLSDQLERLGAEVHAIPAIDIRPVDDPAPLDRAVRDLSSYHWIVFTSANGVGFFLDRAVGLGVEIPGGLAHLEIAAIGPSTRQALEERGVTAAVVPAEYRAEGLVAALVERGIAGKRVLIPRARVAREALPEGLTAAGADVTVVPVYETIVPEGGREALRKLFDGSRIRVVTFTSPSTVDAFHRLAPDTLPSDLAFAAIGPITAQRAIEQGYPPAVTALRYTADGLAEAIASYFGSRGRKP